MGTDTVPDKVTLLFAEDDARAELFSEDGESESTPEDGESKGTPADDRVLVHRNVFSLEEMKDLPTTLSHRLEELGEDHDLFVVGNRATPEDSTVLALFLAKKKGI